MRWCFRKPPRRWSACSRAAERSRFRVTPRGGGTSVVGGFDVAREGPPWVIADLSRMDRILTLSKIDRTVTAQAGIALTALEAALAPDWLTIGHYPQSFEGATLGGSIMANGSGQRSDRYGRIADNLVSARIAAPSGLWSSENFRHAASGPWLGGLVAGSEGLFGILADATLRLHATPEHVEDRGLAAAVVPGSGRCGAPACAGGPLAGHAAEYPTRPRPRSCREFRLVRDGLAEPPFLERTLLQVKRAPPQGCLVIAGYEGSNQGTGPAFRQAGKVFGKAGGVALGTAAGRFLAQVALPGAASAREPDGAGARRRHVRDRGAVVEPRIAACRGQPRAGGKRCARRWTARVARSCSAISATPIRRAPASISRRSFRAASSRSRAMAHDQAGGDRGDPRQWRFAQPPSRRRRRPCRLAGARARASSASSCLAPLPRRSIRRA